MAQIDFSGAPAVGSRVAGTTQFTTGGRTYLWNGTSWDFLVTTTSGGGNAAIVNNNGNPGLATNPAVTAESINTLLGTLTGTNGVRYFTSATEFPSDSESKVGDIFYLTSNITVNSVRYDNGLYVRGHQSLGPPGWNYMELESIGGSGMPPSTGVQAIANTQGRIVHRQDDDSFWIGTGRTDGVLWRLLSTTSLKDLQDVRLTSIPGYDRLANTIDVDNMVDGDYTTATGVFSFQAQSLSVRQLFIVGQDLFFTLATESTPTDANILFNGTVTRSEATLAGQTVEITVTERTRPFFTSGFFTASPDGFVVPRTTIETWTAFRSTTDFTGIATITHSGDLDNTTYDETRQLLGAPLLTSGTTLPTTGGSGDLFLLTANYQRTAGTPPVTTTFFPGLYENIGSGFNWQNITHRIQVNGNTANELLINFNSTTGNRAILFGLDAGTITANLAESSVDVSAINFGSNDFSPGRIVTVGTAGTGDFNTIDVPHIGSIFDIISTRDEDVNTVIALSPVGTERLVYEGTGNHFVIRVPETNTTPIGTTVIFQENDSPNQQATMRIVSRTDFGNFIELRGEPLNPSQIATIQMIPTGTRGITIAGQQITFAPGTTNNEWQAYTALVEPTITIGDRLYFDNWGSGTELPNVAGVIGDLFTLTASDGTNNPGTYIRTGNTNSDSDWDRLPGSGNQMGTTVVANPGGVGNADLTSVSIAGTAYDIPTSTGTGREITIEGTVAGNGSNIETDVTGAILIFDNANAAVNFGNLFFSDTPFVVGSSTTATAIQGNYLLTVTGGTTASINVPNGTTISYTTGSLSQTRLTFGTAVFSTITEQTGLNIQVRPGSIITDNITLSGGVTYNPTTMDLNFPSIDFSDEDLVTKEVQRSTLTGARTSNIMPTEERLRLTLPSNFVASSTGGGEVISDSGFDYLGDTTSSILNVGANQASFPVGTIFTNTARTARFEVTGLISTTFVQTSSISGLTSLFDAFDTNDDIFFVTTAQPTVVTFEITGPPASGFTQGAIPSITLSDNPTALQILQRVADGAVAHYTTAPLIEIAQAPRVVPGDSTLVEVVLDLNRGSDSGATGSTFTVTDTTANDEFVDAALNPIGSTYTFTLGSITIPITSINQTRAEFIPTLITEFNTTAVGQGWTMQRVGTTDTIQVVSNDAMAVTGLWTVTSDHGSNGGDIEFGTFTEIQNGNQAVLGFGSGLQLANGILDTVPNGATLVDNNLAAIVQNRFFKSRGTDGLPNAIFTDATGMRTYIFGWIYARVSNVNTVVYTVQRFNDADLTAVPDYHRFMSQADWTEQIRQASMDPPVFTGLTGLTYTNIDGV